MLIEVKEIHPPVAANRSATVIAMDGKRYDVWPDVLRGIQVGRSYEIQTKPRPWKDKTFFTILKATPVSAAPTAAPPTAPAPTSTGEAEYVGRTLHSLILKGDVTLKNLENVTALLRNIWANTSPELAHYRHAAE